MQLDDQLRARLRALAEQQPCALEEPARTRVRAQLRARLGQSSERRWLWLTVPALGLLVGGLLLQTEVPPPVAHKPERDIAARQPSQPACASAALVSADFQSRPGQEAQLELPRARVVKTDASQLSVTQLTPCQLGLTLARGDVAVHARDLQGGSLWVQGALGRVAVEGTVFSVLSDSARLRVAVIEGRVLLEQAGRELAQVTADQVVSVDAQGALRREALSAQERVRLLARLSLASPQAAPALPTTKVRVPGMPAAPSPSEPADVGPERVWQRGAVESPAGEPREPGTSLQPDGRPMPKPRVVD